MQADVQDNPAIAVGVREEFAALTSACGIFRLDRSLIALTGADRNRWLNGMVTNNVRDLAVGYGVYAFVLNPQGKIQADLYAFNRGEQLLIETDSAQVETILQIFDRYIIMDEVEVENLVGKFTPIKLVGPNSAKVLRSIGFESAEQLQPLQISNVALNQTNVTLIRGDNPGVPNYTIWADLTASRRFWEQLRKDGAQEIQAETIEVFRIACGIPKFGVDIRQKDLPQETGQDRALNFSKGCYIGQEIVERIRSRGAVHRIFTGFEIEGSTPAPGLRIQHEGKDVAELTGVAVVPASTGERTIALGYGRRELMVPGKEYATGETRLRVSHLPFRFS